MKKDRLNLILFIVTLFFLGAFNIFAYDKPTVSLLENRALNTMPQISLKTLLNGEYFRDYEEYFADTFLFRESLVRISGKMEILRGLPTKDRAYVTVHGGANVAPGEKDNSVITEGRILVYEDRAMELHRYNEDAGRYYAQTLNAFASRLPEKVNAYSLLIPTQIEFFNEKIYKNLSSPQNETISQINNYLTQDKIISINAYNILKNHSNEYIYFRTDHHWTSLGAYYAYSKFITAIGNEPIPIDDYETMVVEGFLGTTYRIVLDPILAEHPDTVTIYKPFISQEYQVFYDDAVTLDLLDMSYAEQNGKYGIFLGGDHPLGRIKTAIKNGKSIAVVKDSYGNAFIPFLIPHYQDIYIIDPRSFKEDAVEFIKEEGIQEVLFLNYVLAADNKNFTNHLKRIMGNKLSE